MSTRNMELQAILDASDSDSDSCREDTDVIKSALPSKSYAKAMYDYGRIENKSYRQVDLERILREHSDDDDEEDDLVYPPFGVTSTNGRRYSNIGGADETYSLGATTISTRPYLFQPHTPTRSIKKQNNGAMLSEIDDTGASMQYQKSPPASPSLSKVYDMPRLRSTNIPTQTQKSNHSASKNGECSLSSKETGDRIQITQSLHKNQNPEEWAILQKILNETEDDDDDIDEFTMTTRTSHKTTGTESKSMPVSRQSPQNSIYTDNDHIMREFIKPSINRVQSNTSSALDVDAIINAIDSDSDDDGADLAELDHMIAKLSLNTSRSTFSKDVSASTTIVNDKKSDTTARMQINWSAKGSVSHMKFMKTEEAKSSKNYATNSVAKGVEDEGVRITMKHRSTNPDNGNRESNNINKYLHHYQSTSQRTCTASEAALKAAEEYERRLLRAGQRDIVSPLMVKRRMKPKIELETKSRSTELRQKRTIGAVQQNHRFDFSEMIESKSMLRISAELERNLRLEEDDVGLPTAMFVGSKFIAIGTQCGVILVFDLFEELRQQLDVQKQIPPGSSTVDRNGSVSSIGMASNGENLIAGYTNGHIVLWDVIKGTILKTVSDLHPSPITMVKIVSDKSLSVVSVDAGGLVNKITFVKTMLFSTYAVENECLLDGTAGQILAMDVLPPISSLKTVPMCITDDKKHPYHPSIHRLVLLALSSERSSFGIAIEPSVSVLHRWARPSVEQMDVEDYVNTHFADRCESEESSQPPSVFLPCLSWGWALVSGGENSVTPILARGWGCCIQLLRANFPQHDDPGKNKTDDSMLWPAFGVHDEFKATAPVVALEWLGDSSLVYLSFANELTIVDTVMMTLTERLDFSGMKLVYAEFALSRSTASQSSISPPNETCISTTFQNSIRSSEGRLLVLCQKEVKTLSILGVQQRMAALEEDGEWLEALALALDHYESTIKSQEDRKRNPDGSKDMSLHPEFLSRIRLTEDEEWIADLLLRYLNLAVENAPEPHPDHATSSYSVKGTRIDLAQSHYQMLAGVCIEFCVITRRLDLLFNEIYQCFRDTGYTGVFLDVLEPYILNDKLKYIAPLVMADFIDHCRAANDISTVERCLLHMDVTIMDFDSILSLLRKNSMYSALIHIYTQGLDDFISPLKLLFDGFLNAIDADNPKLEKAYGYKILLFLRHCFTRKLFPTANPLRPEGRIDTLRSELLYFLIQKVYRKASNDPTSPPNTLSTTKMFPYVHSLMNLDSKAFLDTLSLAFDDPEAHFIETIDNQFSLEEWQDIVISTRNEKYEKAVCPDRMDFVRIISITLSSNQAATDSTPSEHGFSEGQGAFYDFMAKYMLKGIVRAPAPITRGVISRMCTKTSQEDIIRLLQVLPKSSYKRKDILSVVEDSQITRAALILHKGGVSELFEGCADSTNCAKHFMSAIDCYLKDDDALFRREVFEYIKNECIGGGTAIINYGGQKEKETTVHDLLRNALCEKLPELINLDPVPCAKLVAEIYVEELEQILLSLKESNDEVIQFKFFHAIISGGLTKADPVAGPVLLANLTIDHHQKYLELMAKFHPDMVYHHLTSSDNYRVEECLKLCQAYDIADASAYLLERMGSVSSALQLMLQTLEGRLMSLKRVVRGFSTSSYGKGRINFGRSKLDNRQVLANLHQEKECQAVRQMLTVALDLCERNSGSSSVNEHGSQLWFNVLDRLINARGFLRLSKELPEHSTVMFNILSDLLRMTMQRMVSNVALPDLVRKITIDHAGSRLGEFREMVTTMLKTYVSELEVCNGAVDVMHYDVHQMFVLKFGLKTKGAKVKNFSSDVRPSSSVLKINNQGIASPLTDDGKVEPLCHNGKNGKTKLSNLSRLRSKRLKKTDKRLVNCRQSKICEGMQTISDKLFQLGESSDAAYMSRFVGVLSEAEHYGRLR